jgi:hypothetical protein
MEGSAFSVKCELHFIMLFKEIRSSDCCYYNRVSCRQSKLPYIQLSSPRNFVHFFNTRLIIFHYPQPLHNSSHRYAVSVKFSETISRAELRIYTDSSRTQYSVSWVVLQLVSQEYYSQQVPLVFGTQSGPEKDRFITNLSSLFLPDQTQHYPFSSPASHLPSASKIWHVLCTNVDCETADSMFLGNA